MATIVESIEISRRPEDVFLYATDSDAGGWRVVIQAHSRNAMTRRCILDGSRLRHWSLDGKSLAGFWRVD